MIIFLVSLFIILVVVGGLKFWEDCNKHWAEIDKLQADFRLSLNAIETKRQSLLRKPGHTDFEIRNTSLLQYNMKPSVSRHGPGPILVDLSLAFDKSQDAYNFCKVMEKLTPKSVLKITVPGDTN